MEANNTAASEALSELVKYLEEARQHDDETGNLAAFLLKKFKLRAALSTPPRNCDRFKNADEALEALQRHCNSSGNGCVLCPVAGCSTDEVECKIAWLFARAESEETTWRISTKEK